MDLGGLSPDSWMIERERGELALMSRVTGDLFTTSLGGTCTVWIDPHESTNGSALSGWFVCNGLTASHGMVVSRT